MVPAEQTSCKDMLKLIILNEVRWNIIRGIDGIIFEIILIIIFKGRI
jgi:hypothetical protein